MCGGGWYVESRMLWGRDGELYKEVALVMCVIIFKVYSGLTLSKCGRASIKSSLAKLSLVAQT